MVGSKGTIVTHLGVAVEIESAGARVRMRVPRKSGLVVGDEVEIDGTRITALPRRTALQRRSPGGGVHVVAANLDVLFVVAAVDPPAKAGLVDRASVAARAAGVTPARIINKIDLDDVHGVVDALTARAAGELPVFTASAHTGAGVEAIRAHLQKYGRGAFVGSSGVGKSSLLNALVPELALAVKTLSAATGAGRHTTTASTLVRLAGGGEIVDTPGVREYGLVDVAAADLAAYFPGFAVVVEGCRFRDCLHIEEPGCSIKRAVTEGRIAPARYEAYRALLAEVR